MFSTTIRQMLAHKLRLVLTTASIALGVAFLAGTLVLTDTMGLAFEQLFGKVSAGTDAVVRAEAPYTASDGVGTSRGPIPASALAAVKNTDGVRAAEGTVSGYALLTDTKGKAVLTSGGAPTQGYSMPSDKKLRGDVELMSGTAPDSADEVAIDATSAEEHHIKLGSHIKVLFSGPTREFTVVGTVGFGGEKNLGGTTSAYFDTATAQKVLGTPGQFDSIAVSADKGVSQAELAEEPERGRPRRARGRHREDGGQGELGRDQEGPQDRRHHVHDLRRRRTVRRVLHHLEHLHDDRHPALTRDRTAARHRQHPAPDHAQPVARGVVARYGGLGCRYRCRPRGGEGPEAAHGRGRVQPAEHVLAARAPHDLGLDPGRHGRHRGRRARPGSPGDEGAAGRGAARLDARGREALAASCRDRPRSHRCRSRRDAVDAVRRPQQGLLRTGPARRDGRSDGVPAVRRPSARRDDRQAARLAWAPRGAGEAERDAQPASYVVDGCCPDDRPHPGREHGRLRLVAEALLR